MFSGIYKSYLSPIYWLLRMFWKDMKWKDRSDIEDDMFRICLRPKLSADAKSINKGIQAVYGRILGIDPDAVSAAVSEYIKLKKEVDDCCHDSTMDYRDLDEIHTKLNDLIVDTFTVAVTEGEREDIIEYCKKNKTLLVCNDEWQNLKEMAEWQAREEMEQRNVNRFKEQTIGMLISNQLGDHEDNDEDNDELDRVENF